MNSFRIFYENGREYVEFMTSGKYKVNALVDKDDWFGFLSKYSWTAIKSKNRYTVKTSINKQSQNIYRVIVENSFDELDWFGATVDHINNNPLDNRKGNLRLFRTALLNTTNISTKSDPEMRHIFKNGAGFKVHFNIGGKTVYKQFSDLEQAQKYKAVLLALRQERYNDLLKKCRDIEFERGLRDKIAEGEEDEIILLLRKYGITML